MQHVAQCYLALGRRSEAKDLLQRLMTLKPKVRKRTGQRVQAGTEPEVEADADPPSEAVAPESTTSEAETMPRPWVDLLMGIIEFEEGDMQSALASLTRAEQSQPLMPDLHLRIGETYIRLRRTDDAARAFQRALDIDGDSPEAHLGLSLVFLRQRRDDSAAEQALIAVGLQHFLPFGHFYLGVALARLGDRERAVLAFETSLSMLPGLAPARRWLAALYGQAGGDPERAALHRSIYKQMRNERQRARNIRPEA